MVQIRLIRIFISEQIYSRFFKIIHRIGFEVVQFSAVYPAKNEHRCERRLRVLRTLNYSCSRSSWTFLLTSKEAECDKT